MLPKCLCLLELYSLVVIPMGRGSAFGFRDSASGNGIEAAGHWTPEIRKPHACAKITIPLTHGAPIHSPDQASPEKSPRRDPTASGDRDAAVNRIASHNYFLLEKFEAGVVLTGTEVKSVRGGLANLKTLMAWSRMMPSGC